MRMVAIVLRTDGRMVPMSARVWNGSAADMEQSIRALREWIAADHLTVTVDRPDEGILELVLPDSDLRMKVKVTAE